ncbi:hypothetical protein ACFL6U_15630 [Planctomycetota bacterium]
MNLRPLRPERSTLDNKHRCMDVIDFCADGCNLLGQSQGHREGRHRGREVDNKKALLQITAGPFLKEDVGDKVSPTIKYCLKTSIGNQENKRYLCAGEVWDRH